MGLKSVSAKLSERVAEPCPGLRVWSLISSSSTWLKENTNNQFVEDRIRMDPVVKTPQNSFIIISNKQTSYIIMSNKGRLPASGLGAKRPKAGFLVQLYQLCINVAR